METDLWQRGQGRGVEVELCGAVCWGPQAEPLHHAVPRPLSERPEHPSCGQQRPPAAAPLPTLPGPHPGRREAAVEASQLWLLALSDSTSSHSFPQVSTLITILLPKYISTSTPRQANPRQLAPSAHGEGREVGGLAPASGWSTTVQVLGCHQGASGGAVVGGSSESVMDHASETRGGRRRHEAPRNGGCC